MAEKDESPQFNPKHRIVGAIVVVALAVLLVPMILEENEPPAELKSVTELPPPKTGSASSDTRVVVTPVAELAEPVKVPAKPEPVIPSVKPVPPPPAAAEEVAPPITETAPDKAPEKVAAAAVKPARTAKAAPVPERISKGWVIQIGVYKERANAERLRKQLSAQGHKVNVDQVTLDGTNATRLRMGPFSDRATALKIQAQIEKESGVKAAVYHYP
jgi:DedD protein